MPGHAPQGLCPKCLLKRGLDTQSAAGVGGPPVAGGFVPPTPAELASSFPELEILEYVGRGGMGMVYKARQKRLDRLVALKILLPQIACDPAFADRFQREAKALAMLSHPQIVTVYDFGQKASPLPPRDGQAGTLYFFLMEFVDGLTLRQLLDSRRIAPPEALTIVPQICEALQYAHDKGVVHRDIKPENILMDRNGQVKIADFGLAKLVDHDPQDFSITGTGQVLGTPSYMAPEQIERPQEVDHRADIYSLGVVFYQMLTGELPLGRFAPPSKKVQVDVRLDEVVLRTLEKEPQLRYQQASEVKSEVQTIAGTPKSGPADEHVTAAIEQVRRQVKGPAIGLLVTGILNWVAAMVIGVVVTPLMIPMLDARGYKPFVVLLAPMLLMAISILVLVAALKMKQLQAYRLAVTVSLLGIFVTPGNVIGLPVGIWALVVLSQREVRAAFASIASKSNRRRELRPGIGPATMDASAWRPPDAGWGWLVGKVFGVTFTSPLAFRCANLSALGFLGFLYALAYASPELHWCRGFAGMFGFFGLIGIAHLIEFTSGLKSRPTAKSWFRRTAISVTAVVLILVIARLFLVEAFIVPGDCAGPEVPRGSRVLAWKLTKTFVPHDLIVYRFDGQTNLGRVVRSEGTYLIVNRNGEADAKVLRDDIIGKVICVYWRASVSPPAPKDSDQSTKQLPETPPAETGVAPQAAGVTAQPPSPPLKPEADVSQPERKARAARIEALRRAYEIVNSQWRIGQATQADRTVALNALLEAQLQSAASKAERIPILEAMLANQRDGERYVEAAVMNGRVSQDYYDRAKADRLEAEIRLTKEKSTAGTDNASPDKNRTIDQRTRNLQDERIASRVTSFWIVDAQYRVASVEFGQRVAASDVLLEAQLDAVESKPARIAILLKLLENQRDLETFAKSAFKNGTGSEADYLRAQADRFASEGRLATEKDAAEPDDLPPKSGEPVKPRGVVLFYGVHPESSLPMGTTRAEITGKLLAAVDRTLNSGGRMLARVRTLDDRLIEVAMLRNDNADRQRVERFLSRPGMLEFRILANSKNDTSITDFAQKNPSQTTVYDAGRRKVGWWVPVKKGNEQAFASSPDVVCRVSARDRDITEVLVAPDPYNITDAYITKAEVDADPSGPCIGFTLNESGGKLFAKLTSEHLPDRSENITYRLSIILDGELISAPKIRAVISNKGKITGIFTKEQAAEIAEALNVGCLPVQLKQVP
jgi:hypothetical protein